MWISILTLCCIFLSILLCYPISHNATSFPSCLPNTSPNKQNLPFIFPPKPNRPTKQSIDASFQQTIKPKIKKPFVPHYRNNHCACLLFWLLLFVCMGLVCPLRRRRRPRLLVDCCALCTKHTIRKLCVYIVMHRAIPTYDSRRRICRKRRRFWVRTPHFCTRVKPPPKRR